MFLWLADWSAFVLPLSVASLRGWAPKRVRGRTTPWGIRVRGVALLVTWVGGLVVPLGRWGGLVGEDAMFLLPAVDVGLLLFAAGLVAGSQLSDRFRQGAARVPKQRTKASASGPEDVTPAGPWSVLPRTVVLPVAPRMFRVAGLARSPMTEDGGYRNLSSRCEPAVRARDLAVDYETVSVDSDATDAARLMADHKLPGLLVLDEHGEPMAILPASQMIKILAPA